MAKDVTKILKRCPENPIINPDDYPGIARIYTVQSCIIIL